MTDHPTTEGRPDLRSALNWALAALTPYDHPTECAPDNCVCGFESARRAAALPAQEPPTVPRPGANLDAPPASLSRAALHAQEPLDVRDMLLEFGQWLADNLNARRGMEEAFDEDEPDQYVATVDAFVSSLSSHNREADYE